MGAVHIDSGKFGAVGVVTLDPGVKIDILVPHIAQGNAPIPLNDFIQKNINVAAPEGRIVSIAFIRGFQAEINFAPLLIKRVTLTGSTLRAQSFAQKTVMTGEIREHIYPHLENGSIKPVVDRVFELADVASAHDYMQSGAHMGKIILRT